MFRKVASLLRPSAPAGAKGAIYGWGEEPAAEASPAAGRFRLPGPYLNAEGHAYRAMTSIAFTGPYDSSAAPRASRLVIYEDDKPLGPRHSVFEIIARDGLGCYAHFLGQVNFSTTDNSDPNTNGRTYSYAVGEPSPATVGLGGCHMNSLVRSIQRAGALQLRGIGMGPSYSPLEQLRLVERQLGLQQEPEVLASLAVSTLPDANDLLTPDTDVDLLLVETTAHTNALVGEVCLNRAQIMSHILGPSEALGREVYEQVSRWYSQGILKCDDDARESAAREVLPRIAGTELDTPAIRLAFAEARGVRETPAEMTERLAAIRDLLGPKRMMVIRGPNVFFPDGRSISWGANLAAEMREVTTALRIPLIDLGDLVKEKGFEFSVLPDLTHHTDAFIDYLGGVVLEKIQSFYGPWPWPEGVQKPLPPRFAR